jgi:hypothetical protein
MQTAYSVETVSCSAARAACSVCQASVAHLTLAVNSHTPEKTSRSASTCGYDVVFAPLVTMFRNISKRTSAEAFVFPFRELVIIDADALEMAQPRALKGDVSNNVTLQLQVDADTISILYGKADLLEVMPPYQAGGDSRQGQILP